MIDLPVRLARGWTERLSDQRTLCDVTLRPGRLLSLRYENRPDDRVVESRPLYAVVQLNWSKEKYPVAWKRSTSSQKSGTWRISAWKLNLKQAWMDSVQENSENE